MYLRLFWNKTVRFLNYPLQVKTLLIAGVAVVAAGVVTDVQ